MNFPRADNEIKRRSETSRSFFHLCESTVPIRRLARICCADMEAADSVTVVSNEKNQREEKHICGWRELICLDCWVLAASAVHGAVQQRASYLKSVIFYKPSAQNRAGNLKDSSALESLTQDQGAALQVSAGWKRSPSEKLFICQCHIIFRESEPENKMVMNNPRRSAAASTRPTEAATRRSFYDSITSPRWQRRSKHQIL